MRKGYLSTAGAWLWAELGNILLEMPIGKDYDAGESSDEFELCDYSCSDFYFDCYESEYVQLVCSTTSPTATTPSDTNTLTTLKTTQTTLKTTPKTTQTTTTKTTTTLKTTQTTTTKTTTTLKTNGSQTKKKVYPTKKCHGLPDGTVCFKWKHKGRYGQCKRGGCIVGYEPNNNVQIIPTNKMCRNHEDGDPCNRKCRRPGCRADQGAVCKEGNCKRHKFPKSCKGLGDGASCYKWRFKENLGQCSNSRCKKKGEKVGEMAW